MTAPAAAVGGKAIAKKLPAKKAAAKAPVKKASAKHAAPSGSRTTRYFNNTKSVAKSTASKTSSVASKTNSAGTAAVNAVTGKAHSSHRKLLAVEYIVGSIVIFLNPLGIDATGVGNVSADSNTYAETVEQFVAFTIVFFILSLMSNAGQDGGAISAGFGGLVVLALLLRPNNADVATKLIPPGFRAKKQPKDSVSGSTNPNASSDVTGGNVETSIIRSNSSAIPVGQPGGVYNA